MPRNTRPISVAQDIVPIAQFKTHASQLLRQMHATRRPLVITQNGKATAVVLTPDEFDELTLREFVKGKVLAGLESAATKPTVSSVEARALLKARVRRSTRED